MSTVTSKSTSSVDMTKGNELRVILGFAIPLFLSNLLLQCYSLTDISIIGHRLGDDALTSIGSVTTIVDLYNSLMWGMSSGFSVVIAKIFGSGDQERLRKATFNTAILSVIWALGISVLGVVTLKPVMRLLNTPESVFETGYAYAVIMISLIGFMFAYNVLSSLLRAIGNSRAPLYFLLFSVILNIALDVLFVYVFDWKLKGAAVATVLSQAVSSAVCLIYIRLKIPELHFGRSDMKIDGRLMSDLFSAGLSFALMFSVVNVGTIVLQGAINGLGEDIIAAHTTARKISSLCMMFLGTLANSMATFAGQNHGAGRYDRVRTGLRKTLFVSMGVATFEIVMIYLFGGMLVKLISDSDNPVILGTAVYYLRFDLPFYYVLAVILITRSTLQGLGSKIAPIIASVMELLLKVFTAGILVGLFAYTGVAMCEPLIWSVCAVYILIVFFMDKRIKQGKTSSREDPTISSRCQ